MTEPLFTCPCCKTPNFTAKGLRSHKCPTLGRALAKEAVQTAIEQQTGATHSTEIKATIEEGMQKSREAFQASKSATVADIKPTGKLELLPSFPSSVEKKLQKHQKNIAIYAQGIIKAGAELFGYAYLAGREMNLAKEIIPHGQFENWIEASFPEITVSTAKRWREFAILIESKKPTVGFLTENKNAVALFKTTEKPKKKLSAAEVKSVLEIIPHVMDGKGMVEFMRGCKFLKEPQEPGGFRPSAEKLETWLKEKHPDLCGKSWDELPKSVKDEFIADDVLGGPRLTQEALDKQVEEERAAFTESLVKLTAGQWVLRLSAEQREDLKRGLQAAIDRLNKLENSQAE